MHMKKGKHIVKTLLNEMRRSACTIYQNTLYVDITNSIMSSIWMSIMSRSLDLTFLIASLASSIQQLCKVFRKTNISYPLMRTCACAYQGAKNVSFSKNTAQVLNGKFPWTITESIAQSIPCNFNVIQATEGWHICLYLSLLIISEWMKAALNLKLRQMKLFPEIIYQQENPALFSNFNLC